MKIFFARTLDAKDAFDANDAPTEHLQHMVHFTICNVYYNIINNIVV